MDKSCHECETVLLGDSSPANKAHLMKGGLGKGVQKQVWIVIFGALALFIGFILLSLLHPSSSFTVMGISYSFPLLSMFSNSPINSFIDPMFHQIPSFIHIGPIFGILLIILGIFEIRFSMKL